jgi:hypothetical protein
VIVKATRDRLCAVKEFALGLTNGDSLKQKHQRDINSSSATGHSVWCAMQTFFSPGLWAALK